MTKQQTIEEITRRLIDFYHPVRIYLFGSEARGEAGPDSDRRAQDDDAPPLHQAARTKEEQSLVKQQQEFQKGLAEHQKRFEPSANGQSDVGMKPGLRRILVALAQTPKGLAAKQVGIRAKISSKSGSFDTYLSTGRTAGWLAGTRDCLKITSFGVSAIGPFEALPTGRALLDHWLAKLKPGAARMLQALVDAWPETMNSVQLGEKASISSISGSFDTYLSSLRTLELIEGPRTELVASLELVRR